VAVIGTRHERWGETPVAVVVPADPASPPTLDELTGWLRGRLASYKKPTALILLDELPRSAAGKVLKHELRAKYGGGLQLGWNAMPSRREASAPMFRARR
jgi:acyl-CoA synthetase (AMP-forming)/AMP-acid ligase II